MVLGMCWESVLTRAYVSWTVSPHLAVGGYAWCGAIATFTCMQRTSDFVCFFFCIVSLLCRSCTFNCWWLAALRAGVYALCAFACLWVDPPYVFISRWWLLWYPGRTFTQHVFFFYSFCGWFSFLFSWGFLWRCVLRFSVKPVWFRCFPPFLHLLHFFFTSV